MVNLISSAYDQVLTDAIHKSKMDVDESPLRPQILLVMPSTSCCKTIADIMGKTASIQQKRCSLGKMITCINVDTWMGLRWSGLQDFVGQADPQFTSHILLSGRRSREV